MPPLPALHVPSLRAAALSTAVCFGILLAPAAAQAQRIECDTVYTVRPGDTLNKIAGRVGIAPVDVMVDWILYANEGSIRSRDEIRVGDELYIPCEDVASAAVEMAIEAPQMIIMEPAAAPSLPAAVAIASMPETPVVDGRATRIFSGPGQFPPEFFGAYAIVAFKAEPPLDEDTDEFRLYRDICEAYVRSIPEAASTVEDRRTELVTVWPLRSDADATAAMEAPRAEQCVVAVRSYGIDLALEAIRDANRALPELRDDFAERRGPFLLAWNPASKKGDPDALILRMDLSWVQDARQARQAFGFWVQRIESNTELWLDDWERRPLDLIVANTADTWGQTIIDSIAFIVGKDE